MSSSAPPTGTLPPLSAATARFDVRGVLGRGASGVVYRALDRETGTEVALKTVPSADIDQIYHLKAEFRSLAQIVHPNLVHLDELVVGPDSCFFTMELLRGKTLSEFVRALAGSDVPRRWTAATIERLRRVVAQVVAGISALHEAGKLHRDIKPSNILVTDDDRAVLVDFGLCTALRLVARTRNPLVGTLLYMAPEQAWGKPLSRAADWYALGAVLYEAIVGRLPFQSEGSRLLFEKDTPPPIPESCDEVALPLLQLAVALMDPLPERRPRAPAVLAALAREGEPQRRGPHVDDLPFVGRVAERAALDAALLDVMEGRPAVAHVEGASGVGKTELVERWLESIERRPGIVILRGHCHSRESVSFNGFDGIVDELSEWMSKLESSELAEVLPADGGALLAMFPVLGRIPGVAADPDLRRAQPYALRQRAFRALRDLLTNIAERYTIIVALDDAHFGGADTALLASEVFRPPNMPRLLLLLTYRAQDDERSTMLAVLRERAPVLFDSIHRVTVGPLGATESCTLGMRLLGRDDEATRLVAMRMAEESGGHPLFLRELAIAVDASPAMTTRAASADLARLLAMRIEQLPGTERSILELASIANRPLPRRVVLAAAGPGERARPDVVRLARKRLLRETTLSGEPALEPYHAKVRDALLASWPIEARRGRHRALADALLAEKELDADALVDQLRGAGDHAGAARYAVIAADRAHAALAFDRAVHLYRVALEVAGEGARALDEPAWRIRARLGAALVDAGRSREAADAYVHASRDAARAGAADAVDLERRAAEHYLRCGRISEGTELLRRVLDASAVPYPASGAAAFATTVALRTRLSIRGLSYRPRRVEDVPPSELARIDACWSAGLGCAWIDTSRAAAFQARYMLLALEAGEPSRVSLGLSTEASQLAAVGGRRRFDRARETMDRALAASEQGGDHQAHAFTLLMAGSIEFYASRWRRSLDLCTRAESLLRDNQSRSEWELMTAHTLGLASMAYLGQLRTLRERQSQLLGEARDRGNLLAMVCLTCGPANVGWLADDDPHEAQRRADDALASWRYDDLQLPRYLHLVSSTQVALYEDAPGKALRLLSSAWPRLVTSMTLYVQNFRVTLRHLRARSALALLASTAGVSRLARGRLLRLARGEARRLASEDVAWAPALARALEGGIAACSADHPAAAAHLESAAMDFRALDMALHAAAADHERGRLVGGDAGRALQRDAEARMLDERVRNPERLSATLVPGVRR